MSVLSLQRSIIYGPVRSRRLGSSLGVNLLPGNYKFCSYNCVYCQYGWTNRHCIRLETETDLPSVDQVKTAVQAALAKDHPLDYITLAGNGEPSLHPAFSEIVDVIQSLRSDFAPGVKTAILSNSSSVAQPEIRDALCKLDEPMMKLDAGTEKTWRRFNRPCTGVDWNDMLSGLEGLSGLTIQSLFAAGEAGNADAAEIDSWVDCLKRVGPEFVQVYTLDRPTAAGDLARLDPSHLESIAARAREGAGVSVGVF